MSARCFVDTNILYCPGDATNRKGQEISGMMRGEAGRVLPLLSIGIEAGATPPVV